MKKFAGLSLLLLIGLLLTMGMSVGAQTPYPYTPTPTWVPSPTYDPNANLTVDSVLFNTYCSGSVDVVVKIVNNGAGWLRGPFDVTLTVNNQNYLATIYGLYEMEPLDINFTVPGLESGDSVQAVADSGQTIPEINEEDNTLITSYTAPEACENQQPDLAVIGVYAPDCDIMGVTVDIENYGTAVSGEAEVSITVNGQTYTGAIPALYPNTIAYVMFPELAYTADPVTVQVDTLNQVEESDENNTFTMTMEKAWWLCYDITPTPTPVVGTGEELLQNGDFESGEARSATDWTFNNLKQNDYRICNSDVAYNGQCAFQFKGGSREPRILLQKITADFDSGQLVVSGWVATENLEPGAKIIMVVRYQDGTRKRVVVRPQLNTSAYTYFGAIHNVRGAVASVKVMVRANQSGGLFRVDDLSVRLAN